MSAANDRKPVMGFYWLTWIVLFIAYKLFFRFKAFGSEKVPKDSRGIIFAPNHASFLDPPLLGISTRRHITFLAKEYLFRVFILGSALRWLGVLPIKSESQDFKSMRQLLRALKDGKRIVVFPEGTRSTDGFLKEAESGVGFLAVKSESWVLPVYIQGTFKAFPKGAKWFKCSPVRVYFGGAFIPAFEKDLMVKQDPYLAVSQKIMAEIKEMKKAVEVKPGTNQQSLFV